jgi:hypothetical protein
MAYNETMKEGNAMGKTIVETDSGEYAYYGETLTIAGESVQILYGESELRREILSDATYAKLVELVSANGGTPWAINADNVGQYRAIIRANELLIQALRATIANIITSKDFWNFPESVFNENEELLKDITGANAEYIAYIEEKGL